MAPQTIRLVEELAFNAWPAGIGQSVDGWRLRFHHSVTRRANSVWTCEARGGVRGLDERIAAVEEFYARWGSKARFQITPVVRPADLENRLIDRGYAGPEGSSCVEVARIQDVVKRTRGDTPFRTTISGSVPRSWMEIYAGSEGADPAGIAARRRILERIGPRTAYVLAELDGEPAACGLGVLERGWVGIFCLATRPEFRRRGAGRAALHAIAAWGAGMGARRTYLQVSEENEPARRLYAAIGFRTLYYYHYRLAPLAESRAGAGAK